MADFIFWNFLDDDTTANLNIRGVGIHEAGLYRGFDADLDGTLFLSLKMDQGTGVKVTLTSLATEFRGVLLTKQGVVIQRNIPAVFDVDPGDVTNDRIDLVILEHQYVFAENASVAVYKLLKGTPAPSPVPPVIANPDISIEMGELYIPSGTNLLTDAGVVYTKALVPAFADNGGHAFLDRVQNWTAEQNFAETLSLFRNNVAISPTGGLLTLTAGNSFIVDDSISVTIDSLTAKNVGTVVKLEFDIAMNINSSSGLILPPGWPNFVAVAGEQIFLERVSGPGTIWKVVGVLQHHADIATLLPDVANLQTATGESTDSPTYANENFITNGDDHNVAIGKIDQALQDHIPSWINHPFNVADFFGVTIIVGNIITNRYYLDGNVLIWQFWADGCTATSSNIVVLLPTGNVNTEFLDVASYGVSGDRGSCKVRTINLAASDDRIELVLYNGGAFPTAVLDFEFAFNVFIDLKP